MVGLILIRFKTYQISKKIILPKAYYFVTNVRIIKSF